MLLYGATGFSGRLLVERAVARGLRPVLAARDGQRLAEVAAAHGLEWHAISLEETERLHALVARAAVVLNAAGPFAGTAPALVDACLAGHVNYLDITGEVQVVEAIAARDHEARTRGVMLMPAVGFDVVPSDCLAVHVARQLPQANTLRIGVDVPTVLSRGSLQTGLAAAADGIWVRRAGALVAIPPGTHVHRFDFGAGQQLALAVSLCDVATAFRSTGIPVIETFLRATIPLWTTLSAMRVWGPVLASSPWRDAMARQSAQLPLGPSGSARRTGASTVVAVATDPQGRRVSARLTTPEAYETTACAAILIAEHVLAGRARPGFWTPAQCFGPDLILALDGVSREDL